jgi:peptidoglycan L-alanyl-D-glutamate endopeptidase CwlK
MPSFSDASKEKLDSCHYLLGQVCELVIVNYDFTVLEGHRSNERQEELFRQGKSKLTAGKSKHNAYPSLAVDLAPYPIDWNDTRRWFLLAGFMFQAASTIDVTLRWGMDWNSNWDFSKGEQTFWDAPHFELIL